MFFVGSSAVAQNFDLYETKLKKKSKVLIFVHGGAWIGGSKSQYEQLGKKLAAAGFCAVIADYRLAPGARHPKPVADLNAIVKKIESTPSKKCDNSEIYLIGHSAGAHMIAFWAGENNDKQVKGFIGLEGIYDIPLLAKAWPDYKDWFLKSEFGDEESWAQASPTRKKMSNPSPWLLVQSEKDELIDTKQTLDFKEHLDDQKISSELLLLKEESHFAVVENLQKSDSILYKAILKFVK